MGIGHDFGCQQRASYLVQHGFSLAFGYNRHLLAREHFRCRDALFFERRQKAREYRLGDECERHSLIESVYYSPFACAFLPGGIEDVIDRLQTVLVSKAEYVARDRDKIAVKLASVIFVKCGAHFVVCHAQPVAHEVVCLADKLHVAILDAVVNHFNEVAGTALANPAAAGLASRRFGADCLEDIANVRPSLGRAARHHGGAVQSAFLAARNARADIVKPF